MATLQKFKLLATQCAVAGSPSRSPTTSPVFQLRRRKTLRMFLARAGSGRGSRLPRQEDAPPTATTTTRSLQATVGGHSPDDDRKALLSNKLKDLFLSSPPFDENGRVAEKIRDKSEELRRSSAVRPGLQRSRTAAVSHRPLSTAFRYRLLRRPWRPALVSIPE